MSDTPTQPYSPPPGGWPHSHYHFWQWTEDEIAEAWCDTLYHYGLILDDVIPANAQLIIEMQAEIETFRHEYDIGNVWVWTRKEEAEWLCDAVALQILERIRSDENPKQLRAKLMTELAEHILKQSRNVRGRCMLSQLIEKGA